MQAISHGLICPWIGEFLRAVLSSPASIPVISPSGRSSLGKIVFPGRPSVVDRCFQNSQNSDCRFHKSSECAKEITLETNLTFSAGECPTFLRMVATPIVAPLSVKVRGRDNDILAETQGRSCASA